MKKIFKNSILLYARFLLLIIGTLLTTRFLTDNLGLVNFGAYSVLASFVATIGFVQGALLTAAQRYYAYSIEDEDKTNLNRHFTSVFIIHGIIICSLIFLIYCTSSLIVNKLLVLPSDKLDVIYILYCSLATFSANLMITPLLAMFIASEKMIYYTLISLLDILCKVAIAYSLHYFSEDRTEIYALSLALESIFIFVIYVLFFRIRFSYVKIKFDRKSIKEISSFILWNFWGSAASVFKIQGINVILNVYFGPLVNAARTISLQANNALNSAVSSVQTAFSPQIVKLYSLGKTRELFYLIKVGSRYNYMLLCYFSIPVFFYCETILSFWLTTVPEYTTMFLRVLIIVSLVNTLTSSLIPAAQATGRIKKYQLIVGGVIMFEVPLAIIMLELYELPLVVALSGVFIAIVSAIARIIIIPPLLNLSKKDYIDEVIYKSVYKSLPYITLVTASYFLSSTFEIHVLIILFTVYVVGACYFVFFVLNNSEKTALIKKLKIIFKGIHLNVGYGKSNRK